MPDETYYSLLEISETVPAAEIKTAYLRLIREVHPDRLASLPAYWQRQAEEKSKEINEAYAVLSNREKRCLYDAQLASYRGSRATTNRTPTSQSATPSHPNATQQGPHSASRPHPHPAQTTGFPSQVTAQGFSSGLSQGRRLLFAFAGSIFAFFAADAFWTSSSFAVSAFAFFFAAILSFGVVCLYQSQISRVLLALRIRPKQQLWATIATILFLLSVGKIANSNRGIRFRGADDQNVDLSTVAPVTSDVHDRDQPPVGSGARQIITGGGPEKIAQSQAYSRTAQQPTSQSDVQQRVPTAAPAAASETHEIGTRQETEIPWRKPLSGSWVGKYNCAQGVTGLTLTIVESAQGGFSGIFDFYPVLGGASFPEGSFSGTVTVGTNDSFEFKPQRWISQPPGFSTVGLSGQYVAEAQQLEGQVTGAMGCTSFRLSRRSGQARVPSQSMSTSLPMFDPSGKLWSIPVDQVNQAKAAGDIKAVKMRDPKGVVRWVPENNVKDALANGGQMFGSAAQGGSPSPQPQQPATPTPAATPQPQQSKPVIPTPVAYDISSLPDSDRNSIESACSDARLVQGAAAYHRCLNTQLQELARYPGTPDLNKLSSIDRASIESACSGARLVQGAAAYHRCLNTQLEGLAQYPSTPDLRELNSIDRASMDSACSGARLIQGAAAYHRCLNTQLTELAQYPATPDLSKLSRVDRNSIESACSGARLVQGPASFHRCLTRQLLELGAQ